MLFPDAFARQDLLHLPAPERDAAAAAAGLPHFAAFLDSVRVADSRPPGRLVRQYMLDLLAAGCFSITSPLTGAALRSGPSLVLVDKSILFAFPDEPDVMLGIGDISEGYPISALVVLRPALFVPVFDSLWGFAERHLAWAAEAIRTTGWEIAPVTGPPTLVTGDPNFAHVAWNQLSALHDLLGHDPPGSGALPANLRVLATQQPLGPILDILPDLPRWPMEALADTSLQARNGPGLLFIPLGASLITAALAGRIHDYARLRMSAEAQALDAALARSGPVLWVSVRTRNRTVVNQQELLVRLGCAFLDAVPGGAVLIDGHSRPDDLAAYPDYHRKETDEVLAADRAAAAALHAALARQAPGRVHSAVGLTVSDSIALGRRAGIYVCHHGTVQHKVGWFNAVPGVVHCNRAILASLPAAWVAAQSAAAIPPVYLPPEAVIDAPPGSGGGATYAAVLRHDNYLVVDVPAAIGAVMRLAEEAGFLPAPARARAGRDKAHGLLQNGLVARCLAWFARPR